MEREKLLKELIEEALYEQRQLIGEIINLSNEIDKEYKIEKKVNFEKEKKLDKLNERRDSLQPIINYLVSKI